jgi:polyhydroxyalkanoate synthesis regulator phasin
MTDTSGVPQRTKRGLDMATAAELGDLLHELTHDKRGRRAVAKLIKEIKPESAHAQAFADVDIEDRFDDFKREQEEERLKRESEAVNRELARQRNVLLTGGPDGEGRKFTEEQVQQIEKLMVDRGIRSYDDGATIYGTLNPPVDPNHDEAPRHGASYQFPSVGNIPFDEFAKNPNASTRDMAYSIIDDLNRRKRA